MGHELFAWIATDASAHVVHAPAFRWSALCIAVLVCLAFLPPNPSLAIALARARSRLHHAARARRPGGAPAARATLGETLPTVAGWALIAHMAFLGKLPVDALTPFLALAAMIAATELVSGTGRLAGRIRAAAASVGAAMMVGIVLGLACMLAGTRSLTALVEAQGAWPWQWSLFERPALIPAFALYAGYTGRLLAVRDGAGPLVHAAQPLARIVLCALGASVFLGGWQMAANGGPGSLLARSAGAVGFVGKAWLCAWLGDVLFRAGPGRVGASVLAVIATIMLGGATIAFPGLAGWEARIGPVMFTAGALVLALSVAAIARSAHPMGEPPTHPAPFA